MTKQSLVTATELDRIRLIIKMLRRKLSLGEWILNDEAITAADVDILQRIVDTAPEPPPSSALASATEEEGYDESPNTR